MKIFPSLSNVILLNVLLILSSSSIFSQSKKEQIEILTNRVDSLNSVVGAERKINNDKTNQINSLNSKIVGLESDISNLNKKLSGLEADKKELNNQISANKTNLTAKHQELSDLQAELNTKTDSLELLRTELTKLKPAPKPVVTNNTNTNNTNQNAQTSQTGGFKSVKIGNQTWMAENLNVSTFRNGDPIPEAKTNEAWEKAGKDGRPAWCYYENDPKNAANYGKLYNWYAVNDSRGLAPIGWHIPTEWSTLDNQLGDDAGKKMKSTSGWNSWDEENGKKTHSGNGTNTSGFSGLPGGLRDSFGTFYGVGDYGDWWSSTEDDTGNAWARSLGYIFGFVGRDDNPKTTGFSVRCLRD